MGERNEPRGCAALPHRWVMAPLWLSDTCFARALHDMPSFTSISHRSILYLYPPFKFIVQCPKTHSSDTFILVKLYVPCSKRGVFPCVLKVKNSLHRLWTRIPISQGQVISCSTFNDSSARVYRPSLLKWNEVNLLLSFLKNSTAI